MKSALRKAIGAFRILRRRAVEVGQPGLTTWTDSGEAAAEDVQAQISAAAHKGEIAALSIEGDIIAMLKDGVVDLVEVKHLSTLAGRAHRVADVCHDIGEAVR